MSKFKAFKFCLLLTTVPLLAIMVGMFATHGVHEVQASPSPSLAYVVEQGGNSWVVQPLADPQSVIDYYAYVDVSDVPAGPFNASSAQTDIEVSETSLLFLYHDTTADEISIVVIHDRPEAQLGETPATGGQVSFTYTGLPAAATRVVGDDPSEGNIPNANWAWAPCCTDGNAVEGGLNGEFSVTIAPNFISGINAWQFLSGDRFNPTRISLNLEIAVTIKAIRSVGIDIKPQSCPNPINTKSNGVLPVAILGTGDFDVTTIDPASVRLEGVAPLRWALEDVATPFEPYTGKEDAYDCTCEGPDGFCDLTIKFKQQEVVTALGDVSDGDVLVLRLTGQLKEEFDGDDFIGEDVVVILKK